MLLVRGGINELYKCIWNIKSFPDETLYDFDLISAYAFAALGTFPIGTYKVFEHMYEVTNPEILTSFFPDFNRNLSNV